MTMRRLLQDLSAFNRRGSQHETMRKRSEQLSHGASHPGLLYNPSDRRDESSNIVHGINNILPLLFLNSTALKKMGNRQLLVKKLPMVRGLGRGGGGIPISSTHKTALSKSSSVWCNNMFNQLIHLHQVRMYGCRASKM